MTNLLSVLLKRICFVPLLFCIVASYYRTPANAAWWNRSGSQSAKAKQSGNKSATLTVDTDDACHLFIDDVDQGQITPEASHGFTIGVGEHILKCKNDTIPDLVWTKAVEVKDTSQVAAVVSLKALHVQYVQALADAHNQKAEADAAAAKQIAEAQAIPQKLLGAVKGSWQGTYVSMDHGNTTTVFFVLDCESLEDGKIICFETTNDKHMSKISYVPVPPNELDGVTQSCYRTKEKKQMKPGAAKDKEGWTECTGTGQGPNRSKIFINGDYLIYRVPGFADINLTSMSVP